MNNFLKETITGRRSIRRYRPEKVTREKILELLALASYAPSSCNLQAWRFVVVDNEDVKQEVVRRGRVNKQLLRAPVFVVASYNRNVTREHYANVQSLAAAIQNFLLLAQAEGLGTLWVCNFKDEKGIRDAVDIPDTHQVLALIEVGYPTAMPKAPRRRPVEEFVSFNHFAGEEDIPKRTFRKGWRWENVLEWQKRYAWRGYPLEKITYLERKEISRILTRHLGEKKALELYTLSGHISSEINRRAPLIDYHYASREIYDAATKFEPLLAKRELYVSDFLETDMPDGYGSLLLLNKVEHMPSKVFESILRWAAKARREIQFIVVFRNRFSWFGLYDFMMRRVFCKNGIDDTFFGTLRHAGPWRLPSRRQIRQMLQDNRFRIIRSYGLFCLPAYRFSYSEWLKSKPVLFFLARVVSFLCSVLEWFFQRLELNRIFGEQIILVSRLEDDAR